MKDIDPIVMKFLVVVHFFFTLPTACWLILGLANHKDGTIIENITHPGFIFICVFITIATLYAYVYAKNYLGWFRWLRNPFRKKI